MAAAFVVADVRECTVVAGAADNCEQTCYDDSMIYYECHHNGPTLPDPLPDDFECGDAPATTQITSPTGCIKDIKYFSFCEGASSGSGADCPMEDKYDGYLKQWANLNTACTSGTNPGGAWNQHDPGECESFPTYCTSFETTGCTNPTEEGALRSKTFKRCETP